MGRRQKPNQAGAASLYVTRAQAIKRLQITLKDFRRLCIIKGIHPHAPRHPKKAGKGSTSANTFYMLKDIQFIANEPIVKKFRAMKVYKRHLKRAIEKRQRFEVNRLRRKRPSYNLNHIVKERYPTFGDALRDLDDCLSMLFLFATFPKSVVQNTLITKARRLTIEFMNYVISSKSLRKVFISIKGYYYQAEIYGEKITWLVPHKFPFERPTDVDFRVMATFVEFYNVLLGFINFKLYHSLNLIYPPKPETQATADQRYEAEMLAALTIDLKTNVSADPVDEEDDANETSGTLKLLPEMLLGSEDKEETARLEKELTSIDELNKLFVGKKFFLGREVPRESIVFVIRAFGGQVSWDATDGSTGATYDESDQSITHQIADRPTCDMKYALTRAYVQPQWVFDSVNARKLVKVDEYLPGATLPPHLSPFSLPSHSLPADTEQMETAEPEAPEEAPPVLKRRRKKAKVEEEKLPADDEKEVDEDAEVPMKVEASGRDLGAAGARGLPAEAARRRTEIAERKLREMLIPKKHKRLYHKFSAKRELEAKAERKLDMKRRAIASGEQVQVGVDSLQKKDKKQIK